MKLTCQIVQDLLPLYEDGVCSEDSREAVQAHLCECKKCNCLCSKTLPKLIPEESAREETVVKHGLRKIRRRWRLSVLAIAMIIPIILLSVLSYHEYQGEGICFSNLNELWSCSRFLDALEDGDVERAASYLDFSDLYREYREAIEMTPEDFMPSYVEVQMGDEIWMAYDWFAQEYLLDEDPLAVWKSLIQANESRALIPIDAWNELMPKDAQLLQGQGYRLSNGTCYFPYETQWGIFMLIDSTWDALKGDANLELTDFTAMLPQQMYLDNHAKMESKAKSAYDSVQARVRDIKDLCEEEFQDYMEQYYAQKLNSYDHIAVKSASYHDAYCNGEGWEIMFGANIVYHGEPLRVKFHFRAENGEIKYLDVSEDLQTSEEAINRSNTLHEVFVPRR